MAKYDTNIKGMRFGLLIAEKRIDKFTWECQCNCGNIIKANIYHLLDGHTQSCGCTRIKNFNFTIHNESKTRLYQCYYSMLKRCKFNQDYIKKNIEVCEGWKNDFLAFKEWAIKNGYTDDLTLERKDVYKNYCPENCCWIKKSQQSDNKSNTIYLNYNGIIKSLTKWAKVLKIERKDLYKFVYKKREKNEKFIK